MGDGYHVFGHGGWLGLPGGGGRSVQPEGRGLVDRTSLATELVSDALRSAIERRRPDGKRLLHHSDRGCQYTSDAYQQTLKLLGITCSMSRRGCCYDNAVMERFFWSLKYEWTNHQRFANLEEARLSVFKYIETFYNPVRLHETLHYLSPDTFEAENAPAVAA